MRELAVFALLILVVSLSGCTIEEVKEQLFGKEEAAPAEVTDGLKIATFNIQVMGQSKLGEKSVMDVLVKIVRNFDIVAVQEIRDSSGETPQEFLDLINAGPGADYKMLVSERTGRTSSKEQYMFIYNPFKVKFTGKEYTFNDTGDVFEREPYLASFNAGSFDFVLVNIHAKPYEDTISEINALHTVVEQAKAEFNEQDLIILGDFNADCSYVNEKDLPGSLLGSYFWVITDDTDTTTGPSDCTYDRIVLTDSTDYTGNKGVFLFDQEYGLNESFTGEVSDHYPIWAEFYTDKDSD